VSFIKQKCLEAGGRGTPNRRLQLWLVEGVRTRSRNIFHTLESNMDRISALTQANMVKKIP